MLDNITEEFTMDDVDLSEVTELDDQKNYCKKMVKILKLEESMMRKRFVGAQTLADFVEADLNIKAEVGEFVGFNYGTINQCMTLVDNAVLNLQNFNNGDFDDVDDGARGMFISLWYNLGLTHLDSVHRSMNELEGIEKEILEKLSTGVNEDGTLEINKRILH